MINDRTHRFLWNVVGVYAVKLGSVLVSVLTVPIMLKYLSQAEYGVWLTLNSSILWLSAFDIGLSNGLKNRLTESLSRGDRISARRYISSAYAMVCLVAIPLVGVALGAANLFDIQALLKIDSRGILDFKAGLTIAIILFGAFFVLKLLAAILLSDQKAAMQSLMELVGNALSTIAIYLLALRQVPHKFLLVMIITFLVPCSVYLIASIGVFLGWYRDISPRINQIEKSACRDLVGLGWKFFAIQFSSLVIFGSTNLVVSNIFGPDQVTVYGIASKYMTVPIMAFSMLTLPLWTAVTDALARGDRPWIAGMMKKMAYVWAGATAGIAVMVVCSPWVFHHWVGDKVKIPVELVAWIGLYVAILNGASVLQQFVFASGDIMKLLWTSLVCATGFLPATYLLCKYMGLAGIAAGLIAATLPLLIVSLRQYRAKMGPANESWAAVQSTPSGAQV